MMVSLFQYRGKKKAARKNKNRLMWGCDDDDGSGMME